MKLERINIAKGLCAKRSQRISELHRNTLCWLACGSISPLEIEPVKVCLVQTYVDLDVKTFLSPEIVSCGNRIRKD